MEGKWWLAFYFSNDIALAPNLEETNSFGIFWTIELVA